MKVFKIGFLIICCIAVTLVAAKDCVWKRNGDFGKYPPLLWDLQNQRSILPLTEGSDTVIRMTLGTKFLIACPGTKIKATEEEFEIAVCTKSNKLRFTDRTYTMEEASCESAVKESISNTPRPCQVCVSNCDNDYYSIGYNLTYYGFYDLIQFRFDQILDTTLWTVHVLRGEHIDSHDGNPSRPSFKTDSDFFDKSPNSVYQQSSQKEAMIKLFGNSDYIDISNSLYFARGHLSPDGDFLTEMEADQTYQFVNVVPQWQAFNNGNWKAIEFATRNLAAKNKTDLHIWTGTYGILTLLNSCGNEVEIYLDMESKIIPAPEITWKIVYRPSTNQAAVLIGHNNPYLKSFPTTLCKNICHTLDWIQFDTTVLSKGPVYCCSVDDFIKIIPALNKEAFVGATDLTE